VQGRGAGGVQQLPLLHHMAMCNAHPHTQLAESVRLLVAAGANINAASIPYGSDRTALIHAVQRPCCSKVMHAFLQNGADVSIPAADGTTTLHLAAAAGRTDSCELLLARADSLVHARNDDGVTALIYAAVAGRLDVVKLMLQYGADVNTADIIGRTPLISATLHHHAQVALCLLRAGADVHAVDGSGCSALMAAVQSDSSTLVQLPLDNGADISATDSFGQNALFKAAHLGHVRMMDSLVQRGLSISAVDNTGTTVLGIAVAGGKS
jgi:ankyrin repeat protein